MVRCDEGKCILESLMCNDEDDCLDGTDEPSTCGELLATAHVTGARRSRRAVLCHVTPLLCPHRSELLCTQRGLRRDVH